MDEILASFITETLIKAAPTTICILIPFLGAYWIFKAREKASAESKIFELGREIANIIQRKRIIGPLAGLYYSYIDDGLRSITERNREKAIEIMLKNSVHNIYLPGDHEKKRQAATTIVAIASERFDNLIPSTVNWTGSGRPSSIFGERIDLKDNHYPFGTILHRQWIEKFGTIYNDLSAIIYLKKYFVEDFLTCFPNNPHFTAEFITNWLEEIGKTMDEIQKVHAKTLTQIQIIDSQISPQSFSINIAIISIYSALLFISGFAAPRIADLTDSISLSIALKLALATTLCYTAIVIRLKVLANPKSEMKSNTIKRLMFPGLIADLESMGQPFAYYRPHTINNILSLEGELRLKIATTLILSKLTKLIDQFNQSASSFCADIECAIIDEFGSNFPPDGKGGFSLSFIQLACDQAALDSACNNIMNSESNFLITYTEMHLTRDVKSIDISELNAEQRRNLCESLCRIRDLSMRQQNYSRTKELLNDIQKTSKRALSMVNEELNKLNT